jgi:hypothetical protein
MPTVLIDDTPVAFDDADAVLETLRAVTSGWRFRPAISGDRPPRLRVRGFGGRYVVSDGDGAAAEREPSVVSVVCTLIVRLVEARADEDPGSLCLHAGAARVGGRLALFPSRRRAGKSTLLARLASLGAEVFADDVSPLRFAPDEYAVVAPGVASRLRLPLPVGFAPDFVRFCDERAGPSDAWYRYLSPAPGMLAPAGATARPDAIVFLDREADAPAELFRATPAGATEALLLQNFGVAGAASEILERVARLVGGCDLYVLRYGALDPAARLLESVFSGRAAPPAGPEIAPPLPETPAGPRGAAPRGPVRRLEGVGVRLIGGRAFLADEDGGAVFALDGAGPAIWALLDEPIRRDAIADLLAEAYGAEPAALRPDVDSFLAALAERGLIRRCEGE